MRAGLFQALLVFTSLAVAVPGLAQDPEPASSQPTVDAQQAAQKNTAGAGRWLRRMLDTDTTLNYQGSFVYVRQAGEGQVEMDTFEITHVVDADGVRERLSSMSGPIREILRHNDEIRSVSEQEQTVMVDQQLRHGRFDRLSVDALLANELPYIAVLGRRGRVAGRPAVEVQMQPRDELRYGVTLWLDRQHALPLKTIIHAAGSEDMALVKLMYTDIRFGDAVDRSGLDSALSTARYRTQTSPIPASRADADQLTPRWQPSKLPEGFQLTYHDHEAAGAGQFEHLVYSDGLASVSIYIEQLQGPEQVRVGHGRMGAMNAWIRQSGDFRVTGLGEVPPGTLQMMVEAVHPVAAAASERPAAAQPNQGQPGS